jgi:hypothetical protein
MGELDARMISTAIVERDSAVEMIHRGWAAFLLLIVSTIVETF